MSINPNHFKNVSEDHWVQGHKDKLVHLKDRLEDEERLTNVETVIVSTIIYAIGFAILGLIYWLA